MLSGPGPSALHPQRVPHPQRTEQLQAFGVRRHALGPPVVRLGVEAGGFGAAPQPVDPIPPEVRDVGECHPARRPQCRRQIISGRERRKVLDQIAPAEHPGHAQLIADRFDRHLERADGVARAPDGEVEHGLGDTGLAVLAQCLSGAEQRVAVELAGVGEPGPEGDEIRVGASMPGVAPCGDRAGPGGHRPPLARLACLARLARRSAAGDVEVVVGPKHRVVVVSAQQCAGGPPVELGGASRVHRGERAVPELGMIEPTVGPVPPDDAGEGRIVESSGHIGDAETVLEQVEVERLVDDGARLEQIASARRELGQALIDARCERTDRRRRAAAVSDREAEGQRVTAGGGEQPAGVLGCRPGARGLEHQRGDRCLVEPAEPQHDGIVGRSQRMEHAVDGAYGGPFVAAWPTGGRITGARITVARITVARPAGFTQCEEDEQADRGGNRTVGEVRDHGLEHGARRRIGQVRVVDGDDHRSVGASDRERPGHLDPDLAQVGRGVGVRPDGETLEQRSHRPQRDPVVLGRAEHDVDRRWAGAQERPQQRRLADTGLAAQHHGGHRSGASGPERRRQGGQLGGAPDERRPIDTTAGRSQRDPSLVFRRPRPEPCPMRR